jgi:uncharacterized protein
MIKYYNENVIENIDPSIVKHPMFNDWFEIVKPVLMHDEFQKRKLFFHHFNLSVWDHSILVSFNAYLYSLYFTCDSRVCALAGLLHDFYPWTWQYNEELEELDGGKYLVELKTKHPLFRQHGFTHGKAASINYVKYFPELEDDRITNSIKRHMFPLTPIPPKYKEGMIITLVYKLNSSRELPTISYFAKTASSKLKFKPKLEKEYNKD